MTKALIDDYMTECHYRGLAMSTIGQRSWALDKLAEQCPTMPCSRLDVMRVVGNRQLADESRKDLMRCIKSFLRWAERWHGLENPSDDLEPAPYRRTLPRVLTVDEVARLVGAARSERDRMLALLVLDTGLRVGEVAGLRRDAIGDGWLAVEGKIGARRVPVSLELMPRLWALGSGDHIWVGKRGPMTRYGLIQTYRKLFRKAEIGGKKIGPHTLRHTFATWYLREGGGLRQLQAILGHTKIQTTMLYVSLAGQDVAADHSRYSPVRRLGLLMEGRDG